MTEETMRREAMRAKRNNLILFSVFVCAALCAMTALGINRYQHTFSPQKWSTAPDSRCKIVDDLLEQYTLVGMTEAEVTQLLGPEDGPAQTSFKLSRSEFPPDSTLVYYLGVEFMDTNWLILSLRDGVVSECYLDVS